MRLIGLHYLSQLRHNKVDVEKWARSWAAEVRDAQWRTPADVTEQFPTADNQGGNLFLFTVEQSDLTVKLLIAFPQGIALISDLNSKDKSYGN